MRKKFKLAYRVDGGTSLGMGHLKRALILRRAFKAIGCSVDWTYFVERDEVGIRFLRHEVGSVIRVPSHCGWKREVELLLSKDQDLILFDILDTRKKVVAPLRNMGRCVVTMEDHGSGVSAANAVINAITDGVKSSSYLCGETSYFVGGDYKVFDESYDRWTIRRKPFPGRLVVSMGGGDPKGATLKVVGSLKGHNHGLEILVILGPAFPRNSKKYQRLCSWQSSGAIRLLESPENLAKVLASAEMAITGGGGTLYEVSRLGVPTLALACAKHQIKNIHIFKANGAVDYLGEVQNVPQQKILKEVRKLKADNKRKRNMERSGKKLVDGKGRMRVVHILKDLLIKNGRKI